MPENETTWKPVGNHAKITQAAFPTGQIWDNLSQQKRIMTPVDWNISSISYIFIINVSIFIYNQLVHNDIENKYDIA